MNQEEEVFSPLLNTFISGVQKYKSQVDMSGIFLPHVLPRYSSASKKFFYCGQDTYWWRPFDEMIQYYENNDISGYIKKNNAWPEVKDIIKYSNNREGNFWTLVIRLHIYLHRQEFINIRKISKDDQFLLEELGWGNLNSIEVPKSLDNEGRWESLNKVFYGDIKEKSRQFDSIKYIFDLYNPDYLFIFNWDNNKENDAFKGLNPHWNESEYWDQIISTYNFDDYKTKVIWCPHPNRLRWHSMNINELIDEIMIRL